MYLLETAMGKGFIALFVIKKQSEKELLNYFY